jgi:nucleotide-binding universal stress UspA family protein
MTIETQPSSNDERKKIEIKNILAPIDGSENSLNAAQYATRIARNEKAQLFCIHIVTPRMPYGYATPAASSIESQNYEDIKHKVESWFDSVRNVTKIEGIPDIKTEIFIDVKSIIESIIDYATRKNIDLIVIGTRGRTGLKKILHGECSKQCETACTLFCPSCQIGISKADLFSRALRYVPMYETEHFELPRKSYSKHSGPKKSSYKSGKNVKK